MPPHYNARRRFDLPIPSLNAIPTTVASNMNPNVSASTEYDQGNSDDEEIIGTDDGAGAVANEKVENGQNTDAENTVSFVENGENAQHSVSVAEPDDSDVNGDETNNENADVESSTNVSQSIDDDDAKHVLAPVNMDLDDEVEMSSLFGDQENPVEANGVNASSPADLFAGISLGHNETAEMRNGKIWVTKKMDDGFEMSYAHGEKPKPLAQLYTIKVNDSISGNIPFKSNATKDRAYLVRIDNIFKEIKMASLLVNGLQCFNNGDNRKKSGLDKAFVKALIIGLCTKKAIKNGDKIHKDLLIFIKGLNIFSNSIF